MWLVSLQNVIRRSSYSSYRVINLTRVQMDGLIRSFVCAPSFALSRDVTPGTQQEAESQNMNMNRYQHAGHSIDQPLDKHGRGTS